MFKKKRDEGNAKYYRKMARRFQIGINAVSTQTVFNHRSSSTKER